MKHLAVCAGILLLTSLARAQSTSDVLKQSAAQGVKDGATVATEKTADKVTDKILGKIFDKKKKNTSSGTNNNTTNNSNTSPTSTSTGAKTTEDNSKNNSATPASLKTYSKFDFIPGDKVLAYDDFSKDAIGDFPVTWNTNSSGEVVTASSRDGHWLMINKPGKFYPTYVKNLPDNFTFEYDVVCNDKYNYYSPPLSVYFLTGSTESKDMLDNWFMADGKRSGIKFSVHSTNGSNDGGLSYMQCFEDGQSVINNQGDISEFNGNEGKGDRHVHISIWRQKQRVRVYLNQDKVYDLPRAFPADKSYTSLLFEISGDMKNQDRYLIGNLKLSVGDPDTRNKLITEGKFVTRGILFDVNSDQIKPESYGVLKDIANVLTENSSVKVKIVGHTDSDGKDADNMTLSKHRAESVKSSLVKDFGIDASRLDTDGKGASQPVDTNSTAAGKANNRRVEFIKE